MSELLDTLKNVMEEVAAPIKSSKPKKFEIMGVPFTPDSIPLVFTVKGGTGKGYKGKFNFGSNLLTPGPKSPTEMQQRRKVLEIVGKKFYDRNPLFSVGTSAVSYSVRGMLKMREDSWSKHVEKTLNAQIKEIIKLMKQTIKGNVSGTPTKEGQPGNMTIREMKSALKVGKKIPMTQNNFDVLLKNLGKAK